MRLPDLRRRAGAPQRPAEWTFVLVKPDAVVSGKAAAVAAELRAQGATVTPAGECWLTVRDVDEWYPEIRDEPHYPAMAAYLTSAPVAFIRVDADAAFDVASRAKRVIRATWGSGELRNWVHTPDSTVDRDSEWELFRPRMRAFAVAPVGHRARFRGR